MSGVEETVAVGCFQKFLNCCPSAMAMIIPM